MAAQGIINQNQYDPMAPAAANGATDVLAAPPATPATVTQPAGTGILSTPAGSTTPVPDVATPSTNTAAPATTQAPADYTSQIQNLYQQDFGRQADQAGLDYWNNAMQNQNVSLDQTDAFMKNSNEYKKLHGSQNPMPGSPVTAAQLGTPTPWNVTSNQTVQGQLTSLIDPNNPYYQQWATAGAQDAAARGFTGNSSIRDTGIMNSVMANATPIATSDAGTYAKAAGYNADEQNQFAVKNQDANNAILTASLSANTQKYLSDQSAATQKAVQQMSTAGQMAISQAHDANSTLIQNNQAASSAYTNYVAAIAQIDQNGGMTEDAKRTAITTQTQIFNSAIAGLTSATPGTPNVSSPLDISNAAQQVGGVDVSNVLNFGGG